MVRFSNKNNLLKGNYMFGLIIPVWLSQTQLEVSQDLFKYIERCHAYKC